MSNLSGILAGDLSQSAVRNLVSGAESVILRGRGKRILFRVLILIY